METAQTQEITKIAEQIESNTGYNVLEKKVIEIQSLKFEAPW